MDNSWLPSGELFSCSFLSVYLGKAVMLYAAETIPKLKTRTQKMGGSDPSLQQGEGGKKNKGKKKKWMWHGLIYIQMSMVTEE